MQHTVFEWIFAKVASGLTILNRRSESLCWTWIVTSLSASPTSSKSEETIHTLLSRPVFDQFYSTFTTARPKSLTVLLICKMYYRLQNGLAFNISSNRKKFCERPRRDRRFVDSCVGRVRLKNIFELIVILTTQLQIDTLSS